MITPKALKAELPLKKEVKTYQKTVEEILLGKDPRRLLLIGPCSIHNIDSAYEYALRLKRLASQVEDRFFICMRTYFEKARTALGWKGLLYDPQLDGSHNMNEGMRLARTLLIALAELDLPAASEFLEPHTPAYLADCISWASIGARTCQSPIHRQLASNLDMPIGFKNRCDGNIDMAINACLTAKEVHHYLGINDDGYLVEVKSRGNPLPHLVLRGSEAKPNFDYQSIVEASHRLQVAGLVDAIIVDCSHDNSQRNYLQQPEVFLSAMQSPIRGIMVESFLEAGAQSFPINKRQSITDPCLDWQATEDLILKVHQCVS